MGTDNLEQVAEVTETLDTASNTESTVYEFSTDTTPVSKDEEVAKEETEEETKPEIDVNDPKIKAIIDAAVAAEADKRAQSLKDKRVQKLIDDAAKREQELSELKTQQEADAKRIREEAQFQAEIEAHRKKLENEGVPDNIVEQTLKREVELHKRANSLESEAQRFYKDRDGLKETQLRYQCLDAISEVYGDTVNLSTLKSIADEIMGNITDKTPSGVLAAVYKRKLTDANKPQPKPKQPQKIDSGVTTGGMKSYKAIQEAYNNDPSDPEAQKALMDWYSKNNMTLR